MTTQALERISAAYLAMPPTAKREFVRRLPPHQQAVLERALGRTTTIGWRAEPLSFARHFDAEIQTWRYTQVLARRFRQLLTGEKPRQIWSLPARYGKSMWSSRWGPGWALDRDPTLPVIITSYSSSLSVGHAEWIRNFAEEHSDELAFRLRPDARKKAEWRTEHGGGVKATGILGSATGFPAGLLVVDDPFKDWQEAHSRNRRELVKNNYRMVYRLRLDRPDAAILVVHHRVHREDLTGWLVESMEDGSGEDFDHLVLPSIARAPRDPDGSFDPAWVDEIGRHDGDYLEPERMSPAEVDARIRVLGPYLAAALELQAPTSEEGGVIRRGWWQWYEVPIAKPDAVCTAWDMKLTERSVGDFVVGHYWARKGPDFYLCDQNRGRWDMGTTKVAIALMATRHPECTTHYIENTGRGVDLIPELRSASPRFDVDADMARDAGVADRDEREQVEALIRRGLAGIQPVQPRGTKFARVTAISGLISGKNVWLPKWQPLSLALVDEAAAFPDGENDDMIDTAALALAKLQTFGGTVRAPKAESLDVQTKAKPVTPDSTPTPMPKPAPPSVGRGGVRRSVRRFGDGPTRRPPR